MKKYGKLRKQIFILLMVILFCGALAGCAPKEMNFTSSDGKYEVTANVSWKDSTGKLAGSDLAIFEISNATQEKYIIALPFKKASYLAAWPNLAAYDNAMTKAAIAEYSNTSVISTENATLDHYNAIVTKFTFTFNNKKVVAWIYSIETEKDYVTMMGWTLADRENKYGKEICNVIKSIQGK